MVSNNNDVHTFDVHSFCPAFTAVPRVLDHAPFHDKNGADGRLYVRELNPARFPPLIPGPYEEDTVIVKDLPSYISGKELKDFLSEGAQSNVYELKFGREIGEVLVHFQSEIGG